MRKNLILFILFIAVVSEAANADDTVYSYIFTVQKEGDNVILIEEEIGLATYTGVLERKTHSWQLVDVSGREIFREEFGFSDMKYISRSIDCIDENLVSLIPGCNNLPSYEKINSPITILKIPYMPLGKYVSIKDVQGTEKLRIALDKYADYCGDGRCSVSESYLTCETDCETKAMIFLSSKNQEFKAYNTKISSSQDIVVYSSLNKCQSELRDCIEYDESSHKMNVYVKNPSAIKIKTDGLYVYDVFFKSDVGEVSIESGFSNMKLSSSKMKLSFTDWKDLPMVNKHYTENGKQCIDTFNYKQYQKLMRQCN